MHRALEKLDQKFNSCFSASAFSKRAEVDQNPSNGVKKTDKNIQTKGEVVNSVPGFPLIKQYNPDRWMS